jgi:signal transduction histidine kinase
MNFIRKISGSLSFRLMIMFMVGGYALTELTRVALRATVGDQIEQNTFRDAIFYADLLVDRGSGQIDEELAMALAEVRGFDILLVRGDAMWSVGEPIRLRHFDFDAVDQAEIPAPILRRGRPANDSFRTLEKAWHNGRFLVRTQSRGYNFILGFKPNIENQVQLWSIVSLIGLLALLFLTTRWLFKPLENISDVVFKIGKGNFRSRTNIKRNDELGVLGTAINQMADDIEGMLEAKRDLFLAISHELRTPVTRARVAVELIEDDVQREAVAADMKEMDSLISDLAEAEAMLTRHSTLNRQPQSISQLIIAELNEYFVDSGIAAPKPSNDDYALLDGMRIRLLLRNLLKNALRHTDLKQNRPTVSAVVGEEGLILEVKDSGEGIDAQHLGRVTEAFYRPDASRQRKTGGFGLGLYLCRNIVAAHRGTMTIESEPDKGTSVIVNIPHKVVIEDEDT